uniref:PDZ domain-containing protein n=1 Tax=Alexandrium monilatum TaxID=311494 RepID=A0A7S4W516_9DINO
MSSLALVDCSEEDPPERSIASTRARRTALAATALAAVGLAAMGYALLARGGAQPLGASPVRGANLTGVTQLRTSKFCREFPFLKFFENDPVVHNNLANKGPQYNTREGMVYRTTALGQGAGKEFAKEVDMHIHATGGDTYRPFSSRRNGMQGLYGSINLNSGSYLDARITFYEAATKKQITIPELAFTFFDLDTGSKGTSKEYVTLKGFKEYKLTKETEVKVSELGNGHTKFEASTFGTGDDNPTDPLALTQQQKNRAITVLYDNAREVEFRIGAGAGSGPRFFTFVSRPSLFCAVTLQAGWQPPLHDLVAIPPMEVGIEAEDHEHFMSFAARKGDQVQKGQGLAVTQIPNQPAHTYTAPFAGKVVAVQDQLKPNDNLDHRLNEKILMVVRRPTLEPLQHGNGVMGVGPGQAADDDPLATFVRYWVEVGDSVREGQPIALARGRDGKEMNYTSTDCGSVKARQEGMEPGFPIVMVKDRQLVTLGPYTALPTSHVTSKTAVVPVDTGETFARFDSKVGDVVKRGDRIATVLNSAGKEVPVKATVGGIVNAQQDITPGTKISRIEDRNLATVGKFSPLPATKTQAKTEFRQAANPLRFPFAEGSGAPGGALPAPPPPSTPVNLETIQFVKYHVSPGQTVKAGDKIATVKDEDGREHDILAPQPGIVKHLQDHLQEGMLLSKVMEDQNLATIGRLPILDVGRSEKGSFAPTVGRYRFKEWKVNVGDGVSRGDTVAVLEHSSDGTEKLVLAGKSGAVTGRMEELQAGDIVEAVTKDEDIVTIGKFQEPNVSLFEVGVQAEMDDIFDFWLVEMGQQVHYGDPIAQVSRVRRDGSGRRLSAQPVKIPSPGTGTIDYEADFQEGESIRSQSVGPTIAKVNLGMPWWLALFAALLVLCCCFCCLYRVMEKPRPIYRPMPTVEAEPEPPVKAEPEPPKPEPVSKPLTPPPPPRPEGLRLDFDDRGTIRTVYARYRPLGIKHNRVAPIVAHAFTVNSYAKEELKVKDGWTLVAIDGVDLQNRTDFDAVEAELHRHMQGFPLWPLPLEFRLGESDSSKRVEKFVERPIGLEFLNVAPIRVGKIYPDSPAEMQGVQVGWVLTKIGERDVHENHDFREVMGVFKEGVEALDDKGRRYT